MNSAVFTWLTHIWDILPCCQVLNIWLAVTAVRLWNFPTSNAFTLSFKFLSVIFPLQESFHFSAEDGTAVSNSWHNHKSGTHCILFYVKRCQARFLTKPDGVWF
jgi:hypothetical protein